MLRYLTSKPKGLWQSCSMSLIISLMWLIISCINKSMKFDAVCHAKYQEFSLDFIVNEI